MASSSLLLPSFTGSDGIALRTRPSNGFSCPSLLELLKVPGRGLALTTGDLFSHSVLSCQAGATCTVGPFSRRKGNVEKLWREFFSDPSLWWDHRSEKVNPRYPDFKHKQTQESLWLDNKLTPVWVEAELASLAPGVLQSNIFPWDVRLRSYVKAGYYKKTLELFKQLQREGMDPTRFTFVPVLNACSNLQTLDEGRHIHVEIRRRGFECDVYVTNALVDMYAKCGSIVDAREVFNKMPTRTVVSWNALILGYVKCGRSQEALELSQQMQREGVDLDPFTFVGILNACASIRELEEGRRVHDQIIQRGYESNAHVASSLVDMYAKCGRIDDAQRVFNKMPTRDVVNWTAMIMGYVKCGQGHEALELSRRMQLEGVELDPVTFVGVLNACASIGALDQGRHAHQQIIHRGYESNIYVASSLVDMYAKCGCIESARTVFNKMPTRNDISWCALILGYIKCGQGQETLELFEQMQREKMDLDPIIFVGVLNACASIGALEEGRRVHDGVIERGYDSDAYVASCLVDMYAKCGSIEDAQRVFNKRSTRDIVSWNAMLAGYSRHGYVEEVVKHFEIMCQEVEVDAASFVSLLSACSHGGLVDEGMHYFESMSAVFNVAPTLEHYACIVDLLGRAGRLHEAEDLMMKMPCEPNARVWMALLGACKLHGNTEMAERAAKRVMELDPENVSSCVVLSNIYAAAESEIVQSVHPEKLRRDFKRTTERT